MNANYKMNYKMRSATQVKSLRPRPELNRPQRLECPHQRAKFQTLSDKTALNPPTSFQQLTGVSQNVIEHTWQKLGDVVNCKMLPMVAEARERDRTARMQLGLELINWETRS